MRVLILDIDDFNWIRVYVLKLMKIECSIMYRGDRRGLLFYTWAILNTGIMNLNWMNYIHWGYVYIINYKINWIDCIEWSDY